MPYIGNITGNRFVASKPATQFSGDGSTTAFTLEHSVASDEDILVSVDGVIQEPSVAYAVTNGTTLTFTGAPSNNSGNNIFVYYLFRTVATVNHPENSSLIATSGTFTATTSLGLPKGTTAQRPTPASTEGHIRYNTENKLVYYSNGTSWLKIASAETVLSSVSGNIVNGVATNVTLAGTGFLNDGLIVSFTPSGGSESTVTVTPTSDTAATVAVPSAIYGQSASTVIAIKATNSDNTVSATVNKTVIAAPSGGSVTTSGGERIHTFTSSGTFVNTTTLTNVEYLIIAGGGGGGVANGGGGGGGAGGYRNSFDSETSGGNSSTESKISSLSAASYSVVVGAGGAGNVHGGGNGSVGVQGSNSSFNSIVSTGGGFGGGDNSQSGGNGGSGGGEARNDSSSTPGSGTTGQGFAGGSSGTNAGGGGGGASAVGGNGVAAATGGNGGAGLSSSITGSAVTRAGGGGGGAEAPSDDSGGIGGSGGGGKGGQAGSVGSTPTAGTANTGGGGGASGDYNTGGSHNGQNGGSGIVIIRYAL
tara:strand:+ start:69 stop:1667 length:1599 start_codon:yes stop_codon:yes gene_type:complete